MKDPQAFLQSINLLQPVTETYKQTSEKSYHRIQQYQNTTSYSQQQALHACPRKLSLIKQRAYADGPPLSNIDFAFGHAVGSGAQNYIVTKDLDIALWNGFLAWKIDAWAELEKKGKSLPLATLAVMSFASLWDSQEWEVVILPTGKPAIEVSFCIDCENGYYHYGHIDAILRHKYTGAVAIGEFKTHGFRTIEPAIYANSAQALSYSVVLDAVFPGLTAYEVIYICYSAPSRLWELIPFTKSIAMKVEWIKDLLLDHMLMDKYEEIKLYPKRGESCYLYSRRCEFFGECNLTSHLAQLPKLASIADAEEVDYMFKISDLINQQKVIHNETY